MRIDNHYKQKVTGNIRYTVHAGVAMTYKPAIQSFFERWGGFYVADDSFQRRYHKNRVIYRWAVTSKKAAAFLREIQPYSIVKREQINIALAFQEHIDKNKSKMVGNRGDLALRASIFAERAIMCEKIRLLKKENFPLIEGDA